jgi:alkylation response protein AidB-like acyl-CoA dehydrogenase
MDQHIKELLLESQVALSSIQLGSCRFIFDASLQYSKERVQFDKPIAEHQAIRFKLADMSVETEAAELMIMRATYLRDKTGVWTREALLASEYMTEVADRIGHSGLQVHGGYGYMEEFHISRHYRDLVGLGVGFISKEKIYDNICSSLVD